MFKWPKPGSPAAWILVIFLIILLLAWMLWYSWAPAY